MNLEYFSLLFCRILTLIILDIQNICVIIRLLPKDYLGSVAKMMATWTENDGDSRRGNWEVSLFFRIGYV